MNAPRLVVRSKDIPEMVGLSKPEFFRQLREGRFPKPNVQLTTTIRGWSVDRVEAWVRERMIETEAA